MALPPAGRVATRLEEVLARGRLRAGLRIIGPAFVASVAYVDPGNFATNFQAGGEHGYTLVWVVVLASGIGVLVQYLSAKLGLRTGASLPQVCRSRFSPGWNVVLWMQAEVVAMATDLAEITGAAIGLNLLFGVPLLAAGGVTAVIALAMLAVQQRADRPFELMVIALLTLLMAGVLLDVLDVGHQSFDGLASGLLPRLGPGGATELAVGIVGATVMPHVVYLHSALQQDRIRPADEREGAVLLRYNWHDCVWGLGAAGVVNVAMLCVAAALVQRTGRLGVDQLGGVHAELARSVGGVAALAFAAALIASGLSSASIGTYAGQVVMAGFLEWRVPLVARRIVTMVPSLLVLAFAANPTDALVYSQVVLSFGLPFALVPLAIVTASPELMGPMVNRSITSKLTWLIVALIVALNAWLVVGVCRRLL